jgi:EmrB/QacA subfamily drug resistance transporter
VTSREPAPGATMTARTDVVLLVSAILGQFLSGFALRIFLVSLPTIARALDADILAISWALIAYQLAGISLSVVFGRLGDIHGRYRIYGLGFGIMAVSSLLCGIVPNVLMLVLFRLIQGIGAAMISSVARVLAMEAMPEGSEGRANGFMTVAFHSGVMLGPALGGLVIDLVSWRWIFFLLVPLAVTGALLTATRARRPRATRGRQSASVDYLGAALLVVLTALLTVLLDRRSAQIIGAESKGVMTLAFGVMLVGFIAHESRTRNPVVNLSLFRIRMFTCSVLSLLIIATASSVVAFLMPFYIQDVLHLSPSFMGLIFLAAPAFTITFATVSGYLTDRIGPRIPASLGVIVTTAAFGVGLALRTDSDWRLPTVLMALTGLGTGFFNTPNQTAIIGSVPREYRGFATGMVQTMFGVGSLLGISLGSALFALMFRYYAGVPEAAPSAERPLAFVASMNTTYLVCVALTLVALAASLMRGDTRIGTRRCGQRSRNSARSAACSGSNP